MTTASMMAQCTARRTRIMASAAPTEATARIQKMVSSATKSVLVPPAARTPLTCPHPCLYFQPALPRPCPPVPPRAAARTARRPGIRRTPPGPTGPRPGHARRAGAGGQSRRAEAVVVLLVVTEPHRMRRRLHARYQRHEQLLLGPDQVFPAVVGDLVLVGHGQRARRAGLDAHAAQDAAQVVDLVDEAVPLAGGEPVLARCCPGPRRRWRRPGRPTRTARSRCISPARPATG